MPEVETISPQLLQAELARWQLVVPEESLGSLARYAELLWAKNTQLNLTRHTTVEKFVTRDLADTLALAELLPQGARVLDVGTGGGVPGIPLAIVRPDLHVGLCDSVAKKANAVAEFVTAMELPLDVFHARAEEVLAVERFDVLAARAVASLAKMLTWFADCWHAFDELLLIKGRSWQEERGEARHRGLMQGLELRRAKVYVTPGSDAENTILRITPRDETDIPPTDGEEPPR